MSKFVPYETTGIGSLPLVNPIEAAALSVKALDIPFWPQLPKRSFLEQMIPQYIEGMPSARVDMENENVFVERTDEEIARFYETTADNARIAISMDYARGLYAFLDQVKNRGFRMLKGHVTGPMTFTLGLKDLSGNLVYYDEELREISLMLLMAKARWQVDMLKALSKDALIFIDEPILSALGSTAYMSVSPEETRRMIGAVAGAVRDAGGIAGIHCCGRADWPLVLESGVDVLNFDAYDYGQTLAMYPAEVTAFLKRGGTLAWGIIPTLSPTEGVDEALVINRFRERFALMAERGVPDDLMKKQIIITPACGTGSRTVDETHKIFQILMRAKEELGG